MSSFLEHSEKGFEKAMKSWGTELSGEGMPFALLDPWKNKSEWTGVRWAPERHISNLFIAFDSEIAEWMFHSNFEEGARAHPEKRAENAWRLVLAHEKGHILMDQKCRKAGMNPDSENDRATVLGIQRNGLIAGRLDFHVRAAEEALCDTMMLQEAQKMFGANWKEVGKVLSRIRHAYSERLPFHVGDRYSTWTAIDRMLEDGEIMDPFQAAQFAYEKSVEATGIRKSLAIAIASPFVKEPQEIGERLLEMRKTQMEMKEAASIVGPQKRRPG